MALSLHKSYFVKWFTLVHKEGGVKNVKKLSTWFMDVPHYMYILFITIIYTENRIYITNFVNLLPFRSMFLRAIIF